MEGKVSSTELTLGHKGIHVHTPLQKGRALQHTDTQGTHTPFVSPSCEPLAAGHYTEDGYIRCSFENIQAETTDTCTHREGLSATWTQTHKIHTQDPEARRVIPGPMGTLCTKKIIHTNGM